MRRKPDPASGPDIDIRIGADGWRGERGARTTIRRAVSLAAQRAGCLREAEVTVLLSDDARVRELNRQWRGKDAPTNVLSFPAPSLAPPPGEPRSLGDIVLAYETVRRECEAAGKPFRDHLAHLVVHGFLHLLGHDHATDAEAETMENLEREVLRAFGAPDPYASAQRAHAIKAR